MARELSDSLVLSVKGWGIVVMIFCLGFGQAFAWTPEPLPPDTATTDSMEEEKPPMVPLKFKPTIGLGAGMFTFYGDISNNNDSYHPTVSRVGFDLNVTQPLSDWLDLTFYVIHGKVGANERTIGRNLNFESKITTGGLVFSYNFDHLLPKDRVIEPYIFSGFESFEFLSKTDLFDANGNQYHYWADGSIRNIDENAPNAEQAVEIFRDYTYESDIRELDVDGFGKYAERGWSVPVGVGANLLLNDNWTFKVGTSMHFALTDLVDGITSESIGSRAGTAGNDKFLYTSFSLNYNFNFGKSDRDRGSEDWRDDMDITEYDMDDADGDDVIDFLDDCPDTPEGVEVNIENGCPLDDDEDGVPDYMDDEMNTRMGAIVDDHGVEVEDTVYYLAYARFVDSTGQYVDYTEVRSTNETAIADPGRVASRERRYYVTAGGESKAVTQDMIDYILSLPDVSTDVDDDGNVVYNIGNFDKVEPAMMTQIDLADRNINASVGGSEGDRPLTAEEIASAMENATAGGTAPSGQTVFRVQVGAFSRSVPDEVFNGVSNVVVVKGEDGLTRYLTGSFNNMKSAAEHKVNMVLKGFEGAFIVAYRDGERISLQEAGATIVSGGGNELEDVTAPISVDKSRIKFGVQVGAYANEVPTEMLDQFIQMGNVTPKRSGEITKYILGPFDTYEEAQQAAGNISNIPDAFVVGTFNGNVISTEEAKKLLED